MRYGDEEHEFWFTTLFFVGEGIEVILWLLWVFGILSLSGLLFLAIIVAIIFGLAITVLECYLYHKKWG